MDKPAILVGNGFFVPKELVKTSKLPEHFEKWAYEKESMCHGCTNFPYRHNSVCDECPNFSYHIKLWKKVIREGRRYYYIPIGAKRLLPKILKTTSIEFEEARSRPSFRYKKVKVSRDLRDYQEEAVEVLSSLRTGILQSPPRTGKTVIAVALALKLKTRTLILAHQSDLLRQFYETIYGGKKGKGAFTNAAQVEKEGEPFAVLATKPKHFLMGDIVLATYQSLIDVAKKDFLAELSDQFGLVLVDECHRAAAPGFSRVISAFSSWYKFGVTATPERKDGKHFVSFRILGPVVHTIAQDTIIPKVDIILTGASHNPRLDWVRAMRNLQNNEERNELVVKKAVYDLKRGKSILIPLLYRQHVDEFYKLLVRRIARFKRKTPLENQGFLAEVDNPKDIVAVFHGGLRPDDRERVILRARKKEIRCVIAIRSLVQLGINIPAWDTLYVVMPIANNPNFHQETSRVRTSYPGKTEVMIRHFVDNTKLSTSCFRVVYKTYRQEKMEFLNLELAKEVVKGNTIKEDFGRSKQGKPSAERLSSKEKRGPFAGFRWNRDR